MDRNMLLLNKLTHSHKTSRKFRAEQYWKGGHRGVLRVPLRCARFGIQAIENRSKRCAEQLHTWTVLDVVKTLVSVSKSMTVMFPWGVAPTLMTLRPSLSSRSCGT